jgi:hypothetical protein
METLLRPQLFLSAQSKINVDVRAEIEART